MKEYQPEPNNQVVVLSNGFDLSKREDYKEAVDSLRKKTRSAVFKAWLSAAIDEPNRLEHLEKVVELDKLQHNNNRGFVVISEPLTDQVAESNKILEGNFSGLGFEELGGGMCSDGLIVNGNLSSQLVTNTKCRQASNTVVPK